MNEHNIMSRDIDALLNEPNAHITKRTPLTPIEKDFLLRAFIYYSDASVFAKIRDLLPVQHQKMCDEYV